MTPDQLDAGGASALQVLGTAGLSNGTSSRHFPRLPVPLGAFPSPSKWQVYPPPQRLSLEPRSVTLTSSVRKYCWHCLPKTVRFQSLPITSAAPITSLLYEGCLKPRGSPPPALPQTIWSTPSSQRAHKAPYRLPPIPPSSSPKTLSDSLAPAQESPGSV